MYRLRLIWSDGDTSVNWLIPAVWSTMMAALVATGAFSYLFAKFRERYIGAWTIAWGVYSLRLVVMVVVLFKSIPVLFWASHICSVVHGVFILWGTYNFLGRRLPRWWLGVAFLCGLWVAVAILAREYVRGVEFLTVVSAPTSLFRGATNIIAGVVLLRYSRHLGMGMRITAWSLILWGIHVSDYPFLRPVLWFAPWGYIGGTTLSTLVAFGMLITYFEKLSSELRQSETRLRAVFESAENVSFVITDAQDPEPHIIEISPGAESIFGYKRAELIGKPVSILHQPEDVAQFPKAHKDMREGKKGFSGEMMLIRKSGERFPALFTMFPLLDETGQMYAALGISVDMSEQKRHQEERLELEQQLRQSQKMEAIGQLAGGVAHDFNNLLQAIQGYTELSLEQLESGHPGVENLLEVRKAAVRAASLTRQLLAFSRRETLHREVLNLNDLIEDFSRMLQRIIGEHVELSFSPGKDLQNVYVDRGQIEQILMNLSINARDAMPKGGVLTISTGNVHFDTNFCRRNTWAEEGHFAEIVVTDTGVGIAPEIKERVFEPFFSTKEMGEGTGLGLATVYAVVQRHEGMVTLDSEEGKGTTFRIYLPVTDKPLPVVHALVEGAETSGGSETILLAEDDELVCRLACTVLESAGYRLLVATNGQEALDLLDRHIDEVDLVIVDVIMPKKGGRDVYSALKKKRPEVPVLFSSGYSYTSLENGHLPEGGSELIQKPYRPKDLLRRVRAIIEAKRHASGE